MLITKLVPQKRGSRFNVFIDGKFAFGVSAFVAVKYKISENTQLTDEEYLSIYKDDQTEYLKQKALDYLSARPRSEKEVRDKLKSKISTPNTQPPTSKPKFGHSGVKRGQAIGSKKQKNTTTQRHSESRFNGTKNLIPKSHTKLLQSRQAGDLESISTEIIEEVISFLKKYDYLNDVTFANWLCEQRLAQGKGEQFIKQDLYKKGVEKQVIEQVIKKLNTGKALEQSYKKAVKKYSKETDKYKQKQKIYRYLLSRGFSYDEINNLFS